MSLKPWEMDINGYTWLDMPGQDAEERLLNFALYRYKKLDLAFDGEARKLRVVVSRSCVGLEILAQKRAVLREQNEREKALALEEEKMVADWKAKLMLRLAEWKQKHSAAMKNIAAMAEVNYDNLCKFVYLGKKVATDKLRVVAAVLDALDSGERTLEESHRGRHSRAVEVPAGHIPFKQWVQKQADAEQIKPHTFYARLNKHPELMPQVHKVHGRAWFVKVESEVAA